MTHLLTRRSAPDYWTLLEPDRIRLRRLSDGAEFDDKPYIAIDRSSGKSIICAIGSDAEALDGLGGRSVVRVITDDGSIDAVEATVALFNHALFLLTKIGGRSLLAPTMFLQFVRNSEDIFPAEAAILPEIAKKCGLRKIFALSNNRPIKIEAWSEISGQCRCFKPAK